MAFVKLDCGILDSTLWPDRSGREMFITALLMAEPIELKEPTPTIKINTLDPDDFVIPPGWYGFVPAASTGIARRAGVGNDEAIQALVRLSAPEPESRSPDFDGRRLVRVDGGFIALNYDKYRMKDHTSAERSRRYRERLQSRVTNVTTRVADRSITQAEAEAEADTDKRANASLPHLSTVFDSWNLMAASVGLPKCLILSDKRRRSLAVRINDEFFKTNWKIAMEKVSKSKFCLGESDRGWRASFDWFITPDAVVKIMEGKYESAKNNKSNPAQRIDRAVGTTNEGRSSEYRGLGKVVGV